MPLAAAPFAPKKFMTINGRRMAYIDEGEGDAIVFQHGNPTSSYLWRNVMSHCKGWGRLVACDLIGMGDSEKLPASDADRYSYAEHREYLFALWEALNLGGRVVLVVHDWGSALGFEWASKNAGHVQGIAYMEAIVAPITWADWPENARRVFQNFRSPAGEEMVLQKNVFVERVLPSSVMRALSEAELNEYRRPFTAPGEDRRPTLSWPRQIPIDGEPKDCGADRAGLRRLARGERRAETVRQRRAGVDSHRSAARLLPDLAEPARSDRQREALRPRGQSR